MNEPQLQYEARVALEQAVHFSLDCQQPDGHWVAEVSADVTFTSEYVMFKYAIGLDLNSDGNALRRWLLQDQKEDGSWTLGPELAGNVSTTTEAYLALKILGTPADDPAMLRARDFMIRSGGIAKVRFFTRFFLATFGLFPWESIPQLPAELILMPPSSPLNIYTLSSWARSTLVPILIVHHHKPLYALPNGLSSNNDFLDELWVDATNKNVPFAPPLPELFSERAWIEFGFTAIDKIIAQMGGLRKTPLRNISRRRCVKWLLEHQEEAGEWAGFFPPMHGSIWALLLEGFSLEDKVIRSGLAALERLASEDERGKRIAATVSPVWDTALMAGALCDAGLPDDPRVQQATEWVMRKQIYGPQGDWRVYCTNESAGGWSFEYENTFYPDVDDTAVVILTLVKQNPQLVGSQSIADAVSWILGMQNYNGGWGAFDTNNESLWLHKIPFSDMDSLCDPASADITGRILECFGFLLAKKNDTRLDVALELEVIKASWRGVLFLIKEQEASGGWWGRWGSNYIYGTSNVLRGLVNFAWGSPEVKATVVRGLKWFESIQNPDGGWGETLNSYDSPELAGHGVSTGAQTAWALEALISYCSVSSKAIQNGIKWLVDHQTVRTKHGASWSTDIYTGTGFPKVLYLGYPFYHHAFPIRALSQYVKAIERANFEPIELPSTVIETLRRPEILLMVTGSRGDIQPFLYIANILKTHYGCRLRIASHLTHKEVIQQQGFDFYEIAGSPEAFANAFTEKPDILNSFMRGDFNHLLTTFKVMLADCLRSTLDNNPPSLSEKSQPTRPFLADVVVSHLPILAHIHAAEMLQVPLVLVSTQPDIPTSDFPHPLLRKQAEFWSPRWWNYATYFLLDLS